MVYHTEITFLRSIPDGFWYQCADIVRPLNSSWSGICDEVVLAIGHRKLPVFAAYTNGDLSGIINGECYKYPYPVTLIENLYVAEQCHKQCGIGRALVNAMCDYARDNHPGCVDVISARNDAIGFYEKCGFVAHDTPNYLRKVVR